MIRSIFGSNSLAGRVKADMDRSVENLREISHRIANAATPGEQGAFGQVLGAELAEAQAAQLETDMVDLADTQLRFEASNRMLQKLYLQLRTAFGTRR